MSWVITPTYDGLVSDADATAYLAAVQAADGQLLEPAVRIAVNNFIVGCKADGIWTAIKASCILAGARTLTGALVPLVGTAPTNVGGLFVSGDYNRKTGLVGDGSTKYLDSSFNIADFGANGSSHMTAWVSTAHTTLADRFLMGRQVNSNSVWQIYKTGTPSATTSTQFWLGGTGSDQVAIANSGLATGFLGASRNGSSLSARIAGNSGSTSSGPFSGSGNVFVFCRQITANIAGNFVNARLAFYSIGESLDLALLDARVTDLINAFAAAIP
jgi:hypothetical protein